MTKDATTPPPSRIPPPGDPKRYVYAEAVQCPLCGSIHLRVYGKLPATDDGAVTRYTRCLDCGARFLVVTERPDGYPG